MMKAPLSIRNILMLTMGLLSLLVALFTLQQAMQQWHRLEDIRALKEATRLGDGLFDAAEQLSQERDMSFYMLHESEAATPDSREDMDVLRKRVDGMLASSLDAMEKYDADLFSSKFGKKDENVKHLADLRADIDKALSQPLEKRPPALSETWQHDTTAIILQARGLWLDFMTRYNSIDPIVALHIQFKSLLGSITEYAGQERSLIGRLLVENVQPTPEQQAQLIRWRGKMELVWSFSDALARQSGLYPAIEPAFKDAHSHYDNLYDMMRETFYTPSDARKGPYPIDARFWLELATETTDSLDALKKETLQAISNYVLSLETEATDAIYLRFGLLFTALALCTFSFLVVTSRVLRPVHDMAEALVKTSRGQVVDSVAIPVARKDEIGQLAQVLGSLQMTMQDLRRNNIALERSNKELDDFAYIASHDLKEPLRGIHNHSVFLLEDNKDKLDEESVKRVGRLIYLSERIEKLVSELLEFSRLGRQELSPMPADIPEMIKDIESTLDVFLAQHNVTIMVQRPMPRITCDVTRVTEVFRNLIVNAAKYNDSVSKIIEIGYLPTRMGPGKKIYRDVLFVKDNGHGIAPEFHEEIFRIFRRLEGPKAGHEEGTGVGLTFVKKIVERHGGKIWLESEAGKGTTFYFTLKDEEVAQNDRTAAA